MSHLSKKTLRRGPVRFASTAEASCSVQSLSALLWLRKRSVGFFMMSEATGNDQSLSLAWLPGYLGVATHRAGHKRPYSGWRRQWRSWPAAVSHGHETAVRGHAVLDG